MLQRTLLILTHGLALLLAAGCDEPLEFPLHTTPVPSPPANTMFDPSAAGMIAGRVTWSGPVPIVPYFQAPLSTGDEGTDRKVRSWRNPHAPVVDPAEHGVAGAVVFLRGIEPKDARPWDLPPVQVEMKDGQFHVYQGAAEQRVGFLRAGDPLHMVSRESWFEILQARGAAFFSLAFPDPDRLRTRCLPESGHVELISGAGHFWMRGHLFVATHPYYCNTDVEGRFALPHVPPGNYELVCWHPNWHPVGHERDTGTLLLIYLTFAPAREKVQSIHVERGQTTNAAFVLSGADFDP